MRWLALGAMLALLALPAAPTHADEGDRAQAAASSALVGQQFRVVVEVLTAPGAIVEVDPAAPGWGAITVVSAGPPISTPEGDRVRHRIEVTAAAFAPGQLAFAPAVTVITDGASEVRTLPPLQLQVPSTLVEGQPLQLSPLPAPRGIGGAESPFLRPTIALGAVAVLGLVASAAWFMVRWLRHRPVRVTAPLEAPAPVASFEHVEQLIDSDPVAAYRAMSVTVRGTLADRFGLPAQSLTTGEIRRRMEQAGLDRFTARLAGGLLENCDAVVYAGFRPASERRHADINMARQIAGEGG